MSFGGQSPAPVPRGGAGQHPFIWQNGLTRAASGNELEASKKRRWKNTLSPQ